MSSEDRTPRITHLWSIWSEAARDLSCRIRAVELVLGGRIPERLDIDEAKRAGALRAVAESFSKTFQHWPQSTATTARKAQQRAEFEAFYTMAQAFLEGHRI